MMNKAASLSGSLLVRKGAAEPSRFGPPVAYGGGVFPAFTGAPFGDAGDSGARVPEPVEAAPVATATDPTRIDQAPVAAPVPAPAAGKPKAPAPRTAGHRIRHSLRLDTGRHRRLKLLSAHTGRSVQDILTEALDNWMNGHAKDARRKGCDCLGTGGCDDGANPPLPADGPTGTAS